MHAAYWNLYGQRHWSGEWYKVHMYIPRVPHSVSSLVRIGTPPAPLPQASLSPPRNQHLPAVEGVGGPNPDDLRKSLAFCLLCGDITCIHYTSVKCRMYSLQRFKGWLMTVMFCPKCHHITVAGGRGRGGGLQNMRRLTAVLRLGCPPHRKEEPRWPRPRTSNPVFRMDAG